MDTSDPRRALRVPAIGLLSLSLVWTALLVLALGFDVLLLASGLVDVLDDPGPIDKTTQVVIRMGWGTVMVAVNATIAWGAYRMLSLRSYATARLAAILSLIPCLGPCFLLGVPFGIWALSRMSRPDVRSAFTSGPG